MEKEKHSIAPGVGFMVAGASVLGSFQKSLLPRSPVDQGIITGLTMALSFTISTVLQDSLESFVHIGNDENSEINGLATSGSAFAAGLAIQKIFEQQENERPLRSIARAAGYWLTIIGVAGSVIHGLTAMAENKTEEDYQLSQVVVLPIGILIALLFDIARYKRSTLLRNSYLLNSPLRVAVVATGVLGFLTAASIAEQKIAYSTQKTVKRYAKPLANTWMPIGHVISLGIMAGGMAYALSKLYHKIESGQDAIEKDYANPPEAPEVSGSRYSTLDWDELSLQGRRHLSNRLSANKINQDLGIRTAKEPIRLYISLDSADTEANRVMLALEEIKRAGAFTRKNLLLIAPTGTGYVNYVMSDSFEYLSQGDCAQVTIQYSKRPSTMSLDRVDEGHIQFRILVNALSKQIRSMPDESKPNIFLFGESLGAWVSQDAFLHSGTDGLIASGISGALWIGTPNMSKWHSETLKSTSLNVERELVGKFDSYKDFLKLPEKRQKQLRYALISHHNDPIVHFNGGLLLRKPNWLNDSTNRPETIPKSAKFRIPATFFQVAVDMKNALQPKPGVLGRVGHDYRGDILDFMNQVYGFKVSPASLETIRIALAQNDADRSGL
jgi:uncharacterized membrane protein